MSYPDQALAEEIGERVERFVRETVASYERDPRREDHGPAEGPCPGNFAQRPARLA